MRDNRLRWCRYVLKGEAAEPVSLVKEMYVGEKRRPKKSSLNVQRVGVSVVWKLRIRVVGPKYLEEKAKAKNFCELNCLTNNENCIVFNNVLSKCPI